MLNGSQPSSHSDSLPPAIHHPEPFRLSAASFPFITLSASLRRLMLIAEAIAPRLQFATLEGEPGTGKHHFAQVLHSKAPASRAAFRRCDARQWLASEADVSDFTGTLYLDRIDLLAPAGQGLLLNLIKHLQDNPPSHFLLLASSHTSLRALVSQNLFLPDLAFRLAAVRFGLPALREHREDIAPIAQALVDRICRHYQQPTAILSSGSLPKLLQYGWPGNVRELASVLETAILESTSGILRPADLILTSEPPLVSLPPASYALEEVPVPATATAPADLSLDRVIQSHIQFVLRLNRGNKLRAARQLGISRSTLYRVLAGESFSGSALESTADSPHSASDPSFA